jgi:hypothetical protein
MGRQAKRKWQRRVLRVTALLHRPTPENITEARRLVRLFGRHRRFRRLVRA